MHIYQSGYIKIPTDGDSLVVLETMVLVSSGLETKILRSWSWSMVSAVFCYWSI